MIYVISWIHMCTGIHHWYTNVGCSAVILINLATADSEWAGLKLKCLIKWRGDLWCKGGFPTVGCIWLTAVTCECWALPAKHSTRISSITYWLPICNSAMLEISVYYWDISDVTGFQISLLNRNDVVHMKQSKKLAQCTHFHQQSILSDNQYYLPPLSGISLGEISSIVLK